MPLEFRYVSVQMNREQRVPASTPHLKRRIEKQVIYVVTKKCRTKNSTSLIVSSYNIVGVTVIVSISRMHRKNHSWNCTMHENLDKVPKFRDSHIPQSKWWHYGSITDIKYSDDYFIPKLFRIRIWIMINCIENYWRMIKKSTIKKIN